MTFRFQVLISISSMHKSELPGTYNKTRIRLGLKKKPNSLQSFSTDPKSPEVNSAKRNRCTQSGRFSKPSPGRPFLCSTLMLSALMLPSILEKPEMDRHLCTGEEQFPSIR